MELLFTGEFPPVSAGIGAFMLARCRAAPPGSIRVLAAEAPGATEWDHTSRLDVTRFAYTAGKSPWIRAAQLWRAYHALRRELRSHSYRLVTANIALPFGWAAAAMKSHGHKVAIFCHDTDFILPRRIPVASRLFDFTMRNCDAFIANSTITASKLADQGWNRDKIHVIHPPVDYERFRPDRDASAMRRSLTSRSGPVILTVARLNEIGKGIDTIIGLLPQLVRRFPDVVYVVAGRGKGAEEYVALAKSLGVADHLLIAGAVHDTDLPLLYASCDAFVMVTRPQPERHYYEGFGIAYREAMACGKPVIASKEAGIRDIIAHGVNGLLVDPLDPREILHALEAVLSDTCGARSLGEQGRVTACGPTDWSALDSLAKGR